MSMRDYGGDDGDADKGGKKRKFDEFDCPSCDANNPYDDGFYAGDEVRCYYCGLMYKVHIRDDGRVKYKEV